MPHHVIFVVLFAFTCLFRIQAEDKSIGLLYYNQALVAYNEGNTDQAKELLDQAILYYPGFSEPYYLYSRIFKGNQETASEQYSYLDKAIAANKWTTTDSSLALREKAGLLLQFGRYGEAKRILLSIKSIRVDDPEVEILYCRVLLALKDNRGFLRSMETDLKRFPTVMEFYKMYARYMISGKSRASAITVIDRGINAGPGNTELLFEKASLQTDVAARLATISDYYIAGGMNPEAALLALQSGTGNASEYLDLFFKLNGNHHIDLLEALYKVIEDTPGLLTVFMDRFTNFEGDRFLDTDNDGAYEEKYSYANNRLLSVVRDSNQDGKIEWEVIFDGGMPSLLNRYDESGQTQYRYSNYPFLKQIIYVQSKTRSAYEIVPDLYRLDFFISIPGQTSDGRLTIRLVTNKKVKYPNKNSVMANAFKEDIFRSGDKNPVKSADLIRGKKVYLRQDTNNDGILDYYVKYANGVPVSGKRDLDGDGDPDLTEIYKNGKLSTIVRDSNKDGKIDYKKVMSKSKGYNAYWDYNFDGVYDCMETKSNGSHTLYFSTGYNGKYNLKVIIRAGIIQSVLKNGRNTPIIKGVYKNTYWIGKKGKAFKIPENFTNGYFKNGNREYFIFQYEDYYYIEEL